MQDMRQIRASKLIGVNVSSKDGDNFGQVQDLVIDPKTGQIQFALVGQGFMAGAGHQMIPVPWEAVNVRSEREFALNIDKKKLESAPAWNQSEMEQPDYTVRIYRFYELEPQTGLGGPGQSGTQSGQGQGSSSSLDQQQNQRQEQPPLEQEKPTQPQP
jgi:sporulation protein YlmC with PRC-barrel domain